MRALRIVPLLLLLGWLGIYQGHLALWNNGDTVPSRVFPQTVDIYPQADQKALEQGIPFESEAQYHRLLEDYLS